MLCVLFCFFFFFFSFVLNTLVWDVVRRNSHTPSQNVVRRMWMRCVVVYSKSSISAPFGPAHPTSSWRFLVPGCLPFRFLHSWPDYSGVASCPESPRGGVCRILVSYESLTLTRTVSYELLTAFSPFAVLCLTPIAGLISVTSP